MTDTADRTYTLGKFSKGRSVVSGRTVHGTNVTCSCGWRWKTNESPSQDGRKRCVAAWKAHECL